MKRYGRASNDRECAARTDGSTYLGHPGTLFCVKPEGHSSSHASLEGAVWCEPTHRVAKRSDGMALALQDLLNYCRDAADDPQDAYEPYTDVARKIEAILAGVEWRVSP